MNSSKSKLSAFFEQEDDEPSLPPSTSSAGHAAPHSKPPPGLDDAKVSQFMHAGTVKKSRREKEQEAAEAKKKEEEASAAKAYAEFLDEFDADRATRAQGFVRGDSGGAAYNPSGGRYASDVSSSRNSARRRSPSPVAGPPRPRGKRAMDAFLEEIKRDQAEREAKYAKHSGPGRSATAMAAYEGQSGSKDRGDPQTTNLFVANLPQNVTEQGLGVFFARCGPVGSVKIMWPRTDNSTGPGADMTSTRRAKSTGLSGFVSFLKRKDAEDALRETDGLEWGGSVLRVGWSKAVPVAPKAMYTASAVESGHHRRNERHRSRSRTPSRERRRGRSRSRSGSRQPYSRSRGNSDSRSPAGIHDDDDEDEVTDMFIRAVAAEVKGQGSKFEASLIDRERNNAKFAFLVKRTHRRHAFYRGLIESERPLDPEFDDEGYNSVYSSDSEEESEREQGRKNVLGKLARKRFEAMLRALSGKRGEIARCMAFSLEHAEAAHEVTDIIIASLLVDSTAVPRKVARLHLICDILNNSAAAVPSAWKFRQEFQARLGVVFDHLATIYHSFPGRITADMFKKQITSVLDVWEDWIVFPSDFIAQMRARLEGTPSQEQPVAEKEKAVISPSVAPMSRFKTSTFQLADDSAPAADDVDGAPLGGDDVDGVPMDDVDGLPMDDVDGVPIDDVDGVPMDDIDGAPLDDDIDGAPIDDDIDGAPIDDVDGEPMELEN